MKCPYCGSKSKWRMHRPTWMKVTPGQMDNIRCSNCGHEFTRWLAVFSLKNSLVKKLIAIWHFILFFITIILIAFIVVLLIHN
ncbi:MAG: hypothetical protein II332_00080 [Kiritimatiellae bacterium]|nr:hypothetical protein [Kiritimatiellia bacterium]